MANALAATKKFQEAQDEVMLLFDGAGAKWIPEFSKPEHRLHGLFSAVRERVTGACSYCAGAFGAKEGIEACGIPLLGEYQGHPSFQRLIA